MATDTINTLPLAVGYLLPKTKTAAPDLAADTTNPEQEDFFIVRRKGSIDNLLPKKLDYHTLVLSISGQCNKKLGPFTFEVAPQTLHFITPRYLHAYSTTADELDVYVIFFTREFLAKSFIKPDILDKLLEINPEVPPLYDLAAEPYQAIYTLYQKMEEEQAATRPFYLNMIRLLLVELLYEMSRACEKCLMSSTRNLSRSYQLVYKFRKMVDEQFLTLRTVQQYADRLNISPKYLGTLIKDETGHNALHLINNRLYLEAEYLLTSGTLDIKQVALHLGFDNSSHFGRFFKQFSGLTPTRFKALHTGK